ncbi:hypothetical protein E3T23_02220 [Cryobacterium cheniae]|uniref:Restriction endonuclease type IV Mrr domain-containing protein n=1 Tax=Cryobacterium cheniae TaxID=1259262 RepID=A0A4R8XX51_9MICO|nr:restriction endonuclease [Cryobacterium cheniae]TFC83390.1 hypothetical protein E3T23_02220 [Cryobacterium cheniae]
MYWLLDEQTKEDVRDKVARLVASIAQVTGTTQAEQLFPFVGRKDLRKAETIVRELSDDDGLVVDPFSGSGIFSYAAAKLGRPVNSNEWEPYTQRMSSSPWRLPGESELAQAKKDLIKQLRPVIDDLYRVVCSCGHLHVIDSQFFDRKPLRFRDVTHHVRLGPSGMTMAYRQGHKCPVCGATDKFFDDEDQRHLDEVNSRPIPQKYDQLFSTELIKNSRINLSGPWTTYGNLFPHRSKLAMVAIWEAIDQLKISEHVRLFLQDAFLAIIMQAKFKDYRGKSQDLHVPDVQLREVNLLFRLADSIDKRSAGLRKYPFATNSGTSPISCLDFRDFLVTLSPGSVQLMLTDPPWTEANAYFEKAQVYHPWLGYRLSDDDTRLANEVVVTDAPSRSVEHNETRWWSDLGEFFTGAGSAIEDLGYLALYFRPTPARRWLENINRLKLAARMAGFEPLLTIDVSSADPSMRIQQSAAYVFSADIVFVFIKLPQAVRRHFIRDIDLDHLAYRAASHLQETTAAPISEASWRRGFSDSLIAEGVPEMNLPTNEHIVSELFERYTREVQPGGYLVRPHTPFAGQLFDVPAAERLFAYVPAVVRELTDTDSTFTYDMFLIRLAGYVENGTRMLINDVQGMDMRQILAPYAVALEDGKRFKKRPVPALPQGISQIMELDPYQFEHFAAELLRRQGYTDVAVQGGSGDRGVDIAAIDPSNQSVVVQCKRYIGSVSATPIQRLHSFAITRGATRRIVMTTSWYTRDAKDEALRTGTELIDGTHLEQLVAQFMPDFGVAGD